MATPIALAERSKQALAATSPGAELDSGAAFEIFSKGYTPSKKEERKNQMDWCSFRSPNNTIPIMGTELQEKLESHPHSAMFGWEILGHSVFQLKHGQLEPKIMQICESPLIVGMRIRVPGPSNHPLNGHEFGT